MIFSDKFKYIQSIINSRKRKMTKNFFYDDFSDRLMISCKKAGDKISGSVRVLNVTLDFTTDNRIINVEIKNVSDYISSLGLNPNILGDLEDAQLMFKQYRDGYVVYFLLKPKLGNIERIPFNVPMKQVLATS
jgi:hypothetical protein